MDAPAVYREFEAVILQSFIESMLPSDAESVFGAGLSGQTWKSMMAEKLAKQIASSSPLGLAQYLSSDSLTATTSEKTTPGAP